MTASSSRRFRPRLWPTLATVVGLAILLSLGTWQFLRYRDKLALEAQREARLGAEPVHVDSLAEFEQKAAPYTPVVIHGHLDPDYTFLFAHRVHDGKPGDWLGGVLHFAKGDGAVIVNRGWVHREHVEQLANEPAPTKSDDFVGLIHQPTEIVADEDARASLAAGELDLRAAPTKWDTYDLTAISDALPFDTPERPSVVVLGPQHSGQPYPVASFDYVTHPYLTSDRHLSYSVFWYVTALALLGMYLGNAFGYLGSPRRQTTSQPGAH